MNRFVMTMLLCGLALTSCRHSDWGDSGSDAVRVVLTHKYFEGDCNTRSSGTAYDGYDRIEFCVADRSGNVLKDIKGVYTKDGSIMELEGLREGEYSLYILAVKGDESLDKAVINDIYKVSDEWISFPSDLKRPLKAEYLYSKTDFTVTRKAVEGGFSDIVNIPSSIEQKRIVGRADFTMEFANSDIANSVISNKVIFDDVMFYTGMTADGNYSGRSLSGTDTLDLTASSQLLFMPTLKDNGASGTVYMLTDRYIGDRASCSYVFSDISLVPNMISTIVVRAEHPDNNSGTRFINEKTYESCPHSKILQDDEHHTVYADPSQRKFNTADPLQLSVTDEGMLHLRFYSPKDLYHVTVRGRLPSVSDEYFDIAYFEKVPSFADFSCELTLAIRKAVYRTESGKYIEIPVRQISDLSGMEIKAVSDDPYWEKLEKIQHGWNISFGLYNGNPELPDGGPVGNWMGIRPVHCREVVALFLNFTYMIDMPEHEQILRENEDILYGNGGVEDKVTADKVLAQMRQERTLVVGLVYPGNGVIGLGGGNVFGAYQNAWLTHYYNTYACEIMFHELGHVMGYNHSSSFTYGPWAQSLMNNFYVNNIHQLPVDSAEYLDSKSNANLYN